MKRFIFFLLISASVIAMSTSEKVAETAVLSDKLTVDEIVSKHLEAIGTAKARSEAGSRIIGGKTQVTFRSRGVAQTDGGAVLASDGAKNMVTMKFESSQYPYE